MAMEITQILESLEYNTGTFPKAAVEAAMQMRDEITPALLRILEDTVERASEIVAQERGGAYFAHLYAMYLLAQFQETRAYPLVVRFARLEQDLLDVLAGEFITEDLCRVLASVCGGDTGLIEQLIEDEDASGYVRSAALRSFLVLVAAREKTRDEAMAYYRSLFEGRLKRTHSYAWDSLVACAVRLHPVDVSDHITMAFELGLVDPGFIGPRNVEEALRKDKDSVLENFFRYERGFIGNVVDEMAWWACFKQPKRGATPEPRTMPLVEEAGLSQPTRAVKVKPNAPCPCGSGKKYKKCCGRIA